VTAAEIVLDASALIRGLQRETDDVSVIADRVVSGITRAHAPDLIGPECTNAMLRLVRARRVTADDAAELIDVASTAPIVRHPSAPQARAALELAFGLGISAYDALYAVLAEGLDLPLVTADRRLAEAIDRAVLVGAGSATGPS
jgi:predicted nucleic acid-binding protein